jgi:uncharacterized protein with PQ loop repeat
VLALLVTLTGLAMAIAPLAQARRILRRSSAADVSLLLFVAVALGTGMLALYGLQLGHPALYGPSGFSALANLSVVALVLRLRRAHQPEFVRDCA